MQTSADTSEHAESSSRTAPKESMQLPDWLVKLATESWQAELLISGFAIVSTLQLLDLLEPLAKWVLFNVRSEYIAYLEWVLVYFAIAVIVLPIAFIGHFVVRTFWVGLIGLSSVFPKGFGPERPFTMLPGALAEIERDYPPLPTLIDRTERTASVVFAIATTAAMLLVSFAAILLAFFGIAYAVTQTFAGLPFSWVFFGLLASFLLFYCITVLIAVTPLKHNPRAYQLYLRLSRYYRTLTFTFFEYPATYVVTLLTTNVSSKRGLAPVVLAYVIVFAGFFYLQSQPAMETLSEIDRVAARALVEDTHVAQRYEDEWPSDGLRLDPFVSSFRQPIGGILDLSLPILGEDEHRLSLLTPTMTERPESMSKPAWKSLKRTQKLNRYFRFRLNDGPLLPLQLLANHPHGEYPSAKALFQLPDTLPGIHRLYVDTWNPAVDSFEARAVVPFLLEK